MAKTKEQRDQEWRDQRRADDLRMMREPSAWPQWPVLPIKKPVGGGRMPDCAVLLEAHGATVFHSNMYKLHEAKPISSLPQTKFTSFEELVAAGWTVD